VKALVTGAGGFLGKAIATKLRARSDEVEVRSFSRESTPSWNPSVSSIPGAPRITSASMALVFRLGAAADELLAHKRAHTSMVAKSDVDLLLLPWNV
jgi:nucleoside-diphosphate-sugar epimerase